MMARFSASHKRGGTRRPAEIHQAAKSSIPEPRHRYQRDRPRQPGTSGRASGVGGIGGVGFGSGTGIVGGPGGLGLGTGWGHGFGGLGMSELTRHPGASVRPIAG